MKANGWSVNALASELGCDRRTVSRRVARLEPLGDGRHGPKYRLRDVVALLREDGTLGELWQPVDEALVAFLDAATEDLDALADRLARTRNRAKARRLVLELVADASYRALHAANPSVPEPPDWTQAPEGVFERAFAALRDPEVTLDHVVDVLEGQDFTE